MRTFRIGHLYSPVYNRMIILEYAGLCVTYTSVGVFGYFCMVDIVHASIAKAKTRL